MDRWLRARRAWVPNASRGFACLVVALGVLLATATAARAASEGPPWAAWLAESGLAPGQVGALVVPVEGGEPLTALNAAQAFNPASTMKLLTSYASLSMLGPGYRWRTGAYLRGRLDADVLHGDLVLRGGGDPKLVIEDLDAFVARMRAAGLREVRGDLVLDDAIYEIGGDSVERFDGDPSQPYNVRPFGVLMNFKAVRVVIQPDAPGGRIRVDPELADLRIDDQIRTVKGPCRHGAAGLAVRDVPEGPGGPGTGAGAGPRIRVSGNYSPACGEQSVFTAMLTHPQFVLALFKAAWRARGGVFDGGVRVERGAARGAPWAEWESPRTLVEVVGDVNKFSNNVMARHLLLQIGAESGMRRVGADSRRPPATVERARAVVVDWLRGQGLVFPELVLDNGSGLSRAERISPASMVRLLQHAHAGPLGEPLRQSLPLVGFDGTMKSRLPGEPVAGNAWIKTGSLDEVRTIAGYVNAASGRRHAVVLFVNGPRAEGARPLQDRFLRWVHANG
ncbi:MAG TPA: D-alanyl-D-alanine carboxypeptidase/D-alanyl-D-alanine-endopeptidase [Quisquiliibacterium sp.]|nr:D-alanyl-D-alanine carboxypeptidase/D-alanyl-D-alanine-endopeptidase [Quisquiliibacterium sp.]